MNNSPKSALCTIATAIMLHSRKKNNVPDTVNSDISPSAHADAGSSYTFSNSNIQVSHSTLLYDYKSASPNPVPDGLLWGSITCLDGNTDIFMGTGKWLSQGEVALIYHTTYPIPKG